MSEAITAPISERICQHMNEDHPDALVLYAKAYGNLEQVETAKMLSIDAQGMNLLVQTPAEEITTRVEFDHSLVDAEDAHHTLIDMLKKARNQST